MDAISDDVGALPLEQWLGVISPGGALNISVPLSLEEATLTALLFAGFVDSSVTSSSDGRRVVTTFKPKWELGSRAKINIPAATTAPKVSVSSVCGLNTLPVH